MTSNSSKVDFEVTHTALVNRFSWFDYEVDDFDDVCPVPEYTVNFKVQYKTEVGQSLFVMGNF